LDKSTERRFGSKAPSDYVGIGTTSPAGLSTWLTVRDVTGTTFPQFYIIGMADGDASMKYAITDGTKSYSHGIFNDPSGSDDNFKICNTATLTGSGYLDQNTMIEIHDENAKAGIIDFNHQSRARVFQMPNPATFEINPAFSQLIPFSTWIMVNFDATDYDEHSEWQLAPNSSTPSSFFQVTETGYYQVNSRVDFVLEGFLESTYEGPIHNPNYPGYVSIAIYVSSDGGNSWNMYAQGNKLQGADNGVSGGYNDLRNNLAPNVSDVVKLDAGDLVSIWVWQDLSTPGISIPLRVEEQNGVGGFPTQCYVSIHKIS